MPEPAWGILRVIVGFLLGEGSRLWQEKKSRTERLGTIREELRTIKRQLASKESILLQAIQAMKQNRILPMLSVRIQTMAYDTYISSVYSEYSDRERNSSHVIYQRLRVADDLMDQFHTDFVESLQSGLLERRWEAYIGQIEDQFQSLDVVSHLIDCFLAGKAVDVFGYSPIEDRFT